MLAAAKYIGAGLACSGLIGAGAGIGLIFSSLIASTARNPQIRGQLFSFAIFEAAGAEVADFFLDWANRLQVVKIISASRIVFFM